MNRSGSTTRKMYRPSWAGWFARYGGEKHNGYRIYKLSQIKPCLRLIPLTLTLCDKGEGQRCAGLECKVLHQENAVVTLEKETY